MTASLIAAWNRSLRADPGAPALIDAAAGRTWSRAELDDAAEAWRRRHGAGLAGLPVVFAEANGPDWLTLFLGLLKAGAVAVPLDPAEPGESRRRTAAAAGAVRLWDGAGLRPVGTGVFRRQACLAKLTSGSTGAARAYFFTDAQMLADGRQICAGMGIRPRDLNVGLIHFGHSYGLGNLVVPLFLQGTAILTGISPLPQALAAAIERWSPTVFPSVPPILRALAESDIPARRLRSLRTVISAGAPLPPPVAAEFLRRFGRKIHGFYGSSETGGITYDRSGQPSLSGRSVGRPLPGVTLAPGRAGRFWVRSPAVHTLGNRNRSGGLGRHSPPDLGAIRRNGELALLGRSGRLVKIAARRLDLREVEEALRRLPGVRDAWVALNPSRSDQLAAIVAGELLTAEARECLLPHLAPWKIPRRWVVVPEFPLTSRGKPDTRRLRSLLAG